MKALYQISAILGVICPLITCASFYYCKFSIEPSLSNKRPPIQEKKVNSSPPSHLSFKPPFPSSFLFFTSNE